MEWVGIFETRDTDRDLTVGLIWGTEDPSNGLEIPKRFAILCWAEGIGITLEDATDLFDTYKIFKTYTNHYSWKKNIYKK